VDAHVHLSRWWPEIRRTGYRPDLDYTVRGLLREMDQAGIDFALGIPMYTAPSQAHALAEGRQSFRQSGGRLLPVATVDPTAGKESVRAAVRAMERDRDLVAVKLFPGYRPFYPHDRRLDPVYEFAQRRQMPVLVHQGDTLDGVGLLKFARPLEMDEVAGRFREVRFVLCHLGNPWIDEAVEVLYKNPNVFVDTSGLLPPPTTRYFERAVQQCRDRVESAIISSGAPGRFLYGSDWPLEDLRTAIHLIDRLDLAESDRQAILGGNARLLFGLAARSRTRPE
jgi:uncharacterized protein